MQLALLFYSLAKSLSRKLFTIIKRHALNLYRRHLNESQRSMVAAVLLEPFEKEAKEEQKKHAETAPGRPKTLKENLPELKPQATDKAGKALGVSGRSVKKHLIRKKSFNS